MSQLMRRFQTAMSLNLNDKSGTPLPPSKRYVGNGVIFFEHVGGANAKVKPWSIGYAGGSACVQRAGGEDLILQVIVFLL